jgi:spore maturation protein CgeB
MLAHPRTPGLSDQGFTKENMILYDRFNFQELARQISDLTEQDRKDRTEAALALIADRHLWTHRLVRIAETVLR